MDYEKLRKILDETTRSYRKGPLVQTRRDADIEVTEVDNFPSTREAPSGPNFDKVDMVFFDVSVNRGEAERYRREFIGILNGFSDQEKAMMKDGPSYLYLGGVLGDQGIALRFMALGSTLGLWQVLNPAKMMGGNDDQIAQAVGRGYLLISGYSADPSPSKKPGKIRRS
ncbi:MAG: hypothetical protein KGH78_01795 [Candidatus Micrarchaeota archaeon]|nr:hypothetical protein [Candidatus Micrarchaeota archaeon]